MWERGDGDDSRRAVPPLIGGPCRRRRGRRSPAWGSVCHVIGNEIGPKKAWKDGLIGSSRRSRAKTAVV